MNKFYKNKRFIKWLYDIDSYIASGGDSFYLNAPVVKSGAPVSCVLWRINISTTGEQFSVALKVVEEPVTNDSSEKVYKLNYRLGEIDGDSIKKVCDNAEREAKRFVDDYLQKKNIPCISYRTYDLIVSLFAKAMVVYSCAFTELGESE